MSPAVLGLDTAGSWCSVALLRGADCATRRREVGNAHSGHLLGMVDAVLTEAGIGLSDCAAIAFSAGPGSFTGLRVGCAAAQGLAFGAGLPIAAIGTLDAIARSVVASGDGVPPRTILVAQDARMGEIYWTLLASSAEGLDTVVGPSLATPARLRAALEDRHVLGDIDVGCGNAWAVHRDALQGIVARVVERVSADAADVAWLGRIAWSDGDVVGAEFAAPIYVRDEVALTSAQRDERARARSATA